MAVSVHARLTPYVGLSGNSDGKERSRQKREFGHLDGVFVNAGYSEFLLFEDVTEQSFDKV
jgi:NAD(P)-dependent dehydrogenase (short-subunit alcohol dehydrogenase family)